MSISEHKARSLDRSSSTSSETSNHQNNRSRSEPSKGSSINSQLTYTTNQRNQLAVSTGICRLPDFYSTLLGPTADETVLVGLETLLKVGFGCTTEALSHSDTTTTSEHSLQGNKNEESSEGDHSDKSINTEDIEQEITEDDNDINASSIDASKELQTVDYEKSQPKAKASEDRRQIEPSITSSSRNPIKKEDQKSIGSKQRDVESRKELTPIKSKIKEGKPPFIPVTVKKEDDFKSKKQIMPAESTRISRKDKLSSTSAEVPKPSKPINSISSEKNEKESAHKIDKYDDELPIKQEEVSSIKKSSINKSKIESASFKSTSSKPSVTKPLPSLLESSGGSTKSDSLAFKEDETELQRKDICTKQPEREEKISQSSSDTTVLSKFTIVVESDDTKSEIVIEEKVTSRDADADAREESEESPNESDESDESQNNEGKLGKSSQFKNQGGGSIKSATSPDLESTEINSVCSKLSGNKNSVSWDKVSKDCVGKTSLERDAIGSKKSRDVISKKNEKGSKYSYETSFDNVKVKISRETIEEVTEESDKDDKLERAAEPDQSLRSVTTEQSNGIDKSIKSSISVKISKEIVDDVNDGIQKEKSEQVKRKSKQSLTRSSKKSKSSVSASKVKGRRVTTMELTEETDYSIGPKNSDRRRSKRSNSGPILQLRKSTYDKSFLASILKSSTSSSKTDSYTCTCNIKDDLDVCQCGDTNSKCACCVSSEKKQPEKYTAVPCPFIKPCIKTTIRKLNGVCSDCCGSTPPEENSGDQKKQSLCFDCYTSTSSSTGTDSDTSKCLQNGSITKGQVRYAITKITEYGKFTTFEIMKSTRKVPKFMPRRLEGVFVLKHKM